MVLILILIPRLKAMDDEVVQRVFQEGGRDYFQQQPSTSSSSASSILQSLPLHVVRTVSFLQLFSYLQVNFEIQILNKILRLLFH